MSNGVGPTPGSISDYEKTCLAVIERGHSVDYPQEYSSNITFEISYAEREILKIPEGILISQRFDGFLYFMEILEIRIEQDLYLPYETLDFSVFLFFMLEGHGQFTTGEGRNLSEAHKGICYLTVNEADRYGLHLRQGTYILFYVSPHIEWIGRYCDIWPGLIDLIHETQRSGLDIAFMHKMTINRTISRYLIRMWHLSEKQTEHIELQFAIELKGLLQTYYHSKHLAEQIHYLRSEEKIHEISRYLDQNFQYPNIGNIRQLCERFLITDRTLRRVFFKVNRKTVSNYLKDIRVSHAQKLLLDTAFSVQKIAILCGFRSMNYFCRVFHEKCACSPARFRKGG